MSTLTCIIVDDEPLAVRLLESYVEKTPDLTLLASFTDSINALNAVKEQKPDLLFLDIQMPNMDGYQATAAIRAMTTYARRIPIVAMTANAFADDIRKAKEVGMNDHISKPIDFKELAKILQKWIRV
jgi:CheY-like chemotaxis protein